MLAPSKSSVNGLVGLSHLDCCNSLLKGLPFFSPPLTCHLSQLIVSAAARMIAFKHKSAKSFSEWNLQPLHSSKVLHSLSSNTSLTSSHDPSHLLCSRPPCSSDIDSACPCLGVLLFSQPGTLSLQKSTTPSSLPSSLCSNTFSVRLPLTIQFKIDLRPLSTYTLQSLSTFLAPHTYLFCVTLYSLLHWKACSGVVVGLGVWLVSTVLYLQFGSEQTKHLLNECTYLWVLL